MSQYNNHIDLAAELAQFRTACNDLAVAFMFHKLGDDFDPEYALGEWYKLGDNGEFFVGSPTDFGTFSDGSDYYHWSLSDMYAILSHGIPYDIATEHQDWGIAHSQNRYSEGERPNGWVNLENYALLRKGNPEMDAEDFQRKLAREMYLQMAENLTDEFRDENERIMKEMSDKFMRENFPEYGQPT